MNLDFQQLELFEQWFAVIGWEGLYEVSDWGRVRSLARNVMSGKPGYRVRPGRILIQAQRRNGYLTVDLAKDAVKKTIAVHRLVAEAFVGRCPLGKEVDHIDGDRSHNHVQNLRYVTKSENQKHVHELGRRRQDRERNHGAKLTEANLIEIRRLVLEGMTQRQIAKFFGVCQQTISSIITGKNWSKQT